MRLFLLFASAAALAVASAAPLRQPWSDGVPEGTMGPSVHAGPDGTVHLTYIGPAEGGGRAVFLTSLPAGLEVWTPPRVVAQTPLLFENWADFPSLTAHPDGTLVAQWFQRHAPGARGYSGWFALSSDAGVRWSEPRPLGHEFVSLIPLAGGRTLALWLQSLGRDPAAWKMGDPTMELRARRLGPDGRTEADWLVDPDVCTCCQTSLVALPGGRALAAYRGHTREEVRDILVARFDPARGWERPRVLHPDGWVIAGCPVNGPSLAADGEEVFVSWFTAAHEQPRVRLAVSRDAGATFGEPMVVDAGRPIGRVQTVALGGGRALVLWMEGAQENRPAGIYTRRFALEGGWTAPRLLAAGSEARAAGFPRAARRPDGTVVLAWTDAGPPSRVRVASLDPGALADGVGLPE